MTMDTVDQPEVLQEQEKVFYILTGLSGAGKSLVSHYLEDQGFYCVDNLPPELIEKFVELTMDTKKKVHRVLLVIDVRAGAQFQTLFRSLDDLERKGIRHVIIYLESKDDVLVRRFSETRRRHPLNAGSLTESIQKERHMLADIRERADIVIDTTSYSSAQLKKHIMKVLSEKLPVEKMTVFLTSFGYKYGIPVESDLVFDVRFLPNPHYVPELAPMTGCHDEVCDYIFENEISKKFLKQLTSFLQFLVPQYVQEGKSHLTVSVGCTGGQHRSVAIVEKLSKALEKEPVNLVKSHRDIERRNQAPRTE
jgi:UPF0042 nucleotide-binding protein